MLPVGEPGVLAQIIRVLTPYEGHMRAKLTKHRRFARRIHRTRFQRRSVTRATFSAFGTRPGRPWPSKYFEWIKTFLISGNCRYPEPMGVTRVTPRLRHSCHSSGGTMRKRALLPAALLLAVAGCSGGGSGPAGPGTSQTAPAPTATTGTTVQQGVRDTADTTAANHRTILAHGRFHHAERDQGPAGAHMHRGRRRIVELHGEPGQYLG